MELNTSLRHLNDDPLAWELYNFLNGNREKVGQASKPAEIQPNKSKVVSKSMVLKSRETSVKKIL